MWSVLRNENRKNTKNTTCNTILAFRKSLNSLEVNCGPPTLTSAMTRMSSRYEKTCFNPLSILSITDWNNTTALVMPKGNLR